jgi:hypothetical protein
MIIFSSLYLRPSESSFLSIDQINEACDVAQEQKET